MKFSKPTALQARIANFRLKFAKPTGLQARIAIGTGLLVFVAIAVVIPVMAYSGHRDIVRAHNSMVTTRIDSLSSLVAAEFAVDGEWDRPIQTVGESVDRWGWYAALYDASGRLLIERPGTRGYPEPGSGELRETTVTDADGRTIGRLRLWPANAPSLWSSLAPGWMPSWLLMLLLAAVTASVLGAGYSYILSGWMMSHLARITNATLRIGNGDLTRRIPLEGDREMVELAQSINGLADKLERVDVQRRTVMAEIVHELRRPLTNVQGYAGVMQDQVLDFANNLQESVSAMYRQVQSLSHQMDGLRLFAAADSGELALDLGPEPTAELLKLATEGHETRARERGVVLTIEAATSLPQVHVDRHRISQVMGNLLDNALAHMPDGGEINVSAAQRGNEISVTVADTGDGIDDDVLPHIFERFYSANADKSGGFGLGLTIARNIIELHGGKIHAESTKGKGASFVFSLPIYRKAKETHNTRPSNQHAQEPNENEQAGSSGDRTSRREVAR